MCWLCVLIFCGLYSISGLCVGCFKVFVRGCLTCSWCVVRLIFWGLGCFGCSGVLELLCIFSELWVDLAGYIWIVR